MIILISTGVVVLLFVVLIVFLAWYTRNDIHPCECPKCHPMPLPDRLDYKCRK